MVRVARTVSPRERAGRWAAMTDGEVVKTRADLARKLGVSRVRVTQLLGELDGSTARVNPLRPRSARCC